MCRGVILFSFFCSNMWSVQTDHNADGSTMIRVFQHFSPHNVVQVYKEILPIDLRLFFAAANACPDHMKEVLARHQARCLLPYTGCILHRGRQDWPTNIVRAAPFALPDKVRGTPRRQIPHPLCFCLVPRNGTFCSQSLAQPLERPS